MSKSTQLTDDSNRTGPTYSDGTFVSASVYYMDYRNNGDDGPSREEMYSFTPTVQDLVKNYTFISDIEAQSLTNIFQSWNNAPVREQAHPEAWRSMQVGDIIVFDGDAYIIRPSGYDKLDIIIDE